MKKNQLIYLALAAGIIWYYWKRKKQSTISKPVMQKAKAIAADVVDKMVEATNFQIDDTSFKDLYAKEKKACK